MPASTNEVIIGKGCKKPSWIGLDWIGVKFSHVLPVGRKVSQLLRRYNLPTISKLKLGNHFITRTHSNSGVIVPRLPFMGSCYPSIVSILQTDRRHER
jgi:hypothetical protein